MQEMAKRKDLLQKALLIEYVSLAWNVLAGSGAVITGLISASTALLGFGLDVAIDSLASAILVWSFLRERRGKAQSALTEQNTTRMVGVILLIAGLYVAAQAIHSLLVHTSPEYSLVGVTISIISTVILPPIAYGKIRLSSQLQSVALRGDGVLTGVGACLAGVTLVGLLVNTLFGWWWADSLVALLITSVLLREGWHSYKEAKYNHTKIAG